MNNPIVAMRYDIVYDCIRVMRRDGTETEEVWSGPADKLASQYIQWFTVANRLPDPDAPYAFWLGADA